MDSSHFTLSSGRFSVVLLLIVISIILSMPFSATPVDSAPVALIPRRTPIISSVIDGIVNGGHSGGVSVGLGGSLFRPSKPLRPRSEATESFKGSVSNDDIPKTPKVTQDQGLGNFEGAPKLERSQLMSRSHKLRSRGTGIGGFYSKEMPSGR